MADFRHDRIRLIRLALLKAGWMYVYIGDDILARLPAMIPKVPKPAAVDLDDASSQRVRIDVVIENEFFNAPRLCLRAQKERATLATARRAPTKFCDTRIPDRRVTEDFRPRSERSARERCY
ncbi:hypothetical protein [Paraburkholderia sp. GAS42]|uniref:hypothetical protein n=1 Tax=Paraburkholderia sp. GAS42 TaxID=3035135 RepID=UPI003D19E737